MVSQMIRVGLVSVASHLVSVQSSELIMEMAQHYVADERIVKSVTGDIILDLHPDNIERVFHLPKLDNYYNISFDKAARWYKDHTEEAENLV
jgi:hypothetical protein